MRDFANKYLDKDKELVIYDIGSMGEWNYRDIFSNNPNWKYFGIDLKSGINVDIILDSPYKWQFEDDSVDIVISGQCFEHIEFFWLTIMEIKRILKPNGLLCIIAPSKGYEHRFPVDCWRFYPDGMRALIKYADLTELEVYVDNSSDWGDCVLIAKKKI